MRSRLSTITMSAMLFAAAATAVPAGAVDLTAGVGNVAPTVTLVQLSSSSLTPTAGTTTAFTVTATVSDLNGYNDIANVSFAILKPDGTTVHVASSNGAFQSGSLATATYTKSLTMNFHDAAATGASTYKVRVVATDAAGVHGSNVASLATFNYAQLAALNLGSSSVSLGSSIAPNSTSSITSVSIQNQGNVQIDIQVSGTALTDPVSGASIPVARLNHSLANDMGSKSVLSSVASTLSAFDLASGASSSSALYLQLSVPSGSEQYVPAGTYAGTLTVAAVAG